MAILSFVYITEEGAKVQKKNGKYLVGRNLEIMFEIPENVLEGLVLIDKVQVSSQAMTSFLQNGIPVTWISDTGKYFGRLESTQHVNVFKQAKQIEVRDSKFAMKIARKIITAKAKNQMTVLKRYNRRCKSLKVDMNIRQMGAILRKVDCADTREKIMGYEGIIARYYFEAFGLMVPEEFAFTKRTRQPPKDKFNSMLSFGYTLLMYEIYTALINQGLHPYFGFLHALKNHHPALASDLMEEWRSVIVDSMVMSIVHRHEIAEDLFTANEETGGVYLKREGRNIFLRAYEKKMRTINKYLRGEKSYRYGLRQQTALYAEALMAENADIYEPIILK